MIDTSRQAPVYVSYDLKGVQRYVFSIPRLRYAVGASSLLADFDEASRDLKMAGVEVDYAGGGRGLFKASDAGAADKLEAHLREKATGIGVDLRIGRDADAQEAASNEAKQRLYPFLPPAGPFVCKESGLYPVGSKGAVHGVVDERRRQARTDALGSGLLDELLADPRFKDLAPLREAGTLRLLRNVSPDEDDSAEQWDRAAAGQAALGGRNRWAVVCLDGNDVGQQLREGRKRHPDEGAYRDWLKRMSAALHACTRGALLAGMAEALGPWVEKHRRELGEESWPLPVRPLILGGDDVTLLCHTRLAFPLALATMRKFNELTRQKTDQFPAAGGAGLTLGCGVLFVKTTFPLLTAIGYAEELLANAKSKGRRGTADAPEPTVAIIDWDEVTTTLVRHPADQRRRDKEFLDGDDAGKRRKLHCRPYALDEFEKLLERAKSAEFADLPNSLRELLPRVLARPKWERLAALASVAAGRPAVARLMKDCEDDAAAFCDAAAVAQELARLDAPTAGQGATA